MKFDITRVSAKALAVIDAATPGTYEHGQAIAAALEEGYGIDKQQEFPAGLADAFSLIDAVIQQIKAEGDTATLSCWEHYRASVVEKLQAERIAGQAVESATQAVESATQAVESATQAVESATQAVESATQATEAEDSSGQ